MVQLHCTLQDYFIHQSNIYASFNMVNDDNDIIIVTY